VSENGKQERDESCGDDMKGICYEGHEKKTTMKFEANNKVK
jgi:hypothetical protein